MDDARHNPYSFMHAVGVSKCTQPWDEMDGTDEVRECPRCNAKVYLVEEENPDQLLEFIRISESNAGVLHPKLYRRQDGKFMVKSGALHDWPNRRVASVGFIGALASFGLLGWLLELLPVMLQYYPWIFACAVIWLALGSGLTAVSPNKRDARWYMLICVFPVAFLPFILTILGRVAFHLLSGPDGF